MKMPKAAFEAHRRWNRMKHFLIKDELWVEDYRFPRKYLITSRDKTQAESRYANWILPEEEPEHLEALLRGIGVEVGDYDTLHYLSTEEVSEEDFRVLKKYLDVIDE